MNGINRSASRDSGLTLIELVIVVVLLGLITAVISSVFVTILRAAPSAQFRIDDARSTRALQTWLARDIASTPPNYPVVSGQGGFVFSGTEPSNAQRCAVSGGVNVLHMTWVESGGSGVSYYANYRLVPDGGANRVVRYFCSSSSPSPTIVRLTSDVSSAACPLQPFSEANFNGSRVQSVDLCILSNEGDTGLNAGGGHTRQVLLTVSSRNYVESF